MLNWIKSIMPKMKVSNFTSDWYDGQLLLHLIHEIKPDKVPPVSSLDPRKVLSNCKLAIRTAKTYLKVPMIISPEMLANGEIDELSMMTYLSYFVKPASKSVLKVVNELLPKHKVDNLTNDWNNGIMFAALLEALFPGSFPKWKDLSHSTNQQNLKKVFEVAHFYCEIESPISPKQMASSNVDELSVMTFILRMLYASYRILPERVVVSGPGIVEARCGRQTHFLVDSSKAGPGELEVHVRHSTEPRMSISSRQKSPGVKKFLYLPQKPGTITINVLFSGSPAPGSPFIFSVSDTSGIRILNHELIQTTINLGESIEVSIDAKSMRKGVLTARLIYPSHPPLVPNITGNNGIFTTTLVPKYTGSPTLRFYWDKEEIRSCALQYTVVDIRKYHVVRNSSKNTYIAFELVDFMVESSDLLSFEPLKLFASCDDIHIPIELECIDSKRGHAVFTPTLPGVYSINVICLDKTVEGSPFSITVVDPSKCTFSSTLPKYLELDQPFDFSVNTSEAGPGKLAFKSENQLMFESEVNEKESSQFIVKVVPKITGETMVAITHSGEDIPGSPFPVIVCDPRKCNIVGELVSIRTCITGTPVSLTLSSQDWSNIKPVVKVQGPTARYPIKFGSLQDNEYPIEFIPWEIGEHVMHVTLGGFHLQNSPFSFQTVQSKVGICSASGTGLQQAYTGIPAQFIVFANQTGLVESGGLEIQVNNIVGSYNCKVRVQDNGDGTYNVAYLTEQSGSYLINVVVCKKHIPGSPFRVNVHPGPNASQCEVVGKALNPETMFKIGEPIEFKVNTSKAGTGKLEVSALGARGIRGRVFTTPRDHKGIQDIQVDPSKPGKYRISMKWSGHHIPHSPIMVKVFPGTDASKCKAYGPGIGNGVVNHPTSFTIETKDAGSGVLRILMSGGVKIQVKPISSLDIRTLIAWYCPNKPGDHLISIKWSDKEIIGSPFRVKVAESPTEEDKAHTHLSAIPEELEEEDISLYHTNSKQEFVTVEPRAVDIPHHAFKIKGQNYQSEFATKKTKQPHKTQTHKTQPKQSNFIRNKKLSSKHKNTKT